MIPKFRVWLPDVNKMLNVKALIGNIYENPELMEVKK